MLPTYHQPALQQPLPQPPLPQPPQQPPLIVENSDDFEIEQTPRNDSIEESNNTNTTMMQQQSSDNNHSHEGWQPNREVELHSNTKKLPPPQIGIAEASNKAVHGSSSVVVGGAKGGMRPPLPNVGKSSRRVDTSGGGHHSKGGGSKGEILMSYQLLSTPIETYRNLLKPIETC